MGIELDIHRIDKDYSPDRKISRENFMVGHNHAKETLACYLEQLLDWHYQNPNHDVILVSLDQKNDGKLYNRYHEEIDAYLQQFFRRELIFEPNQLLKDKSKSLCENVIAYGWPQLSSEALKGKFIFCLTGNKKWKAEYANENISKRICFSDIDKLPATPQTEQNIVFFNIRCGKLNHALISTYTEKHLITRVWKVNKEADWKNCLMAEVNVIATDKVRNHKWAQVNDKGLYKKKKDAHLVH
jgi:hypothetical protein